MIEGDRAPLEALIRTEYCEQRAEDGRRYQRDDGAGFASRLLTALAEAGYVVRAAGSAEGRLADLFKSDLIDTARRATDVACALEELLEIARQDAAQANAVIRAAIEAGMFHGYPTAARYAAASVAAHERCLRLKLGEMLDDKPTERTRDDG